MARNGLEVLTEALRKCSLTHMICICSISVRLVGGPSPQEGRLELLFSGVWGTVCVNGFTDASANVVCYMLGYG